MAARAFDLGGGGLDLLLLADGLQGAEMLLRVAYSHYLVPSPDPEQLLETLRTFAGVETRVTPRRRRSG